MDNILNSPNTIEEIKNVVKGLKNGKSSGIDGVINEYTKNTIDDMLHIYVLLLNIILDKGIIPESWEKGILIPIFKNKGLKSDPNSYRRVTLNSCISKMFSAVLNNRLTKFADEFELITCIRKENEYSDILLLRNWGKTGREFVPLFVLVVSK